MKLHHLEALSLAHTEFAQRLALVRESHLDLPTPCTDWSVRDLVVHVVGGYRLYEDRLDGDPVADVPGWYAKWQPSGSTPAELETDFFALGNSFEERFGDPATLQASVPHPAFGTIPGGALLSLRVFDMTVHAWDLARSIGANESLDAGLVDLLWQQWSPSAEFFGRDTKHIVFGPGPSGTVGDDAPTQLRLLDLLGRRP